LDTQIDGNKNKVQKANYETSKADFESNASKLNFDLQNGNHQIMLMC
jgi:hypothetical protein